MTNLEIAKEYLRRIATLDFDGALSLAKEDASFQGPDGTVLGKRQMSEMFAVVGPKFAGPLVLDILGTTCEGRREAIEAKGAAPLTNGKTYRNNYHYSFEIENGVITHSREYCCTKAPDVIFS
jgi:ketosteroid isomerase-like protein